MTEGRGEVFIRARYLLLHIVLKHIVENPRLQLVSATAKHQTNAHKLGNAETFGVFIIFQLWLIEKAEKYTRFVIQTTPRILFLERVLQLSESHRAVIILVYETLDATLILINSQAIEREGEFKLLDDSQALEDLSFSPGERSGTTCIRLTELTLLATHSFNL